jgi:DNA-binding CsgD family transcriptional regulator
LILLRGDVAPLVLVQASERFRLSRRELEIVRLLLGGKTSKEIAADIGISPNTVKTLLRILMAKMGVSTRSGILGKVLMTAAPVALASFLL